MLLCGPTWTVLGQHANLVIAINLRNNVTKAPVSNYALITLWLTLGRWGALEGWSVLGIGVRMEPDDAGKLSLPLVVIRWLG